MNSMHLARASIPDSLLERALKFSRDLREVAHAHVGADERQRFGLVALGRHPGLGPQRWAEILELGQRSGMRLADEEGIAIGADVGLLAGVGVYVGDLLGVEGLDHTGDFAPSDELP